MLNNLEKAGLFKKQVQYSRCLVSNSNGLCICHLIINSYCACDSFRSQKAIGSL